MRYLTVKMLKDRKASPVSLALFRKAFPNKDKVRITKTNIKKFLNTNGPCYDNYSYFVWICELILRVDWIKEEFGLSTNLYNYCCCINSEHEIDNIWKHLKKYVT
jgi:hypothetical protein